MREIEANETVWALINNKLQELKFEVFSPGTHKGVCKAPYLVVKDNGGLPIRGTTSHDIYYDIMVYVPEKRYSELEPYIDKVKIAMKSLEPMVMPMHSNSPSFREEEIEAYMTVLAYKNHRKNL